MEEREMDCLAIHSTLDCSYLAYRLDENQSIVDCGDRLWQLLGYVSVEEFMQVSGGCWTAFFSEENALQRKKAICQQLAEKGNYQLRAVLQRKDGQPLYVVECGTRFPDEGKELCVRAILTDLTDLQEAVGRGNHRYDDLTGLYNRASFCQAMQQLLQENPDGDFEIMRICIERFEVINDLFGEKTGKRILNSLADFLRSLPEKTCLYGRLHASHFVLGYFVQPGARTYFLKTLQKVAADVRLDYKIVLDFGIYCVENRNLPVSVMCDRAGLALDQVRGKYLCACGIYDETMRRQLLHEQLIINDMNEALEHRDFVLQLQPKYELSSERIIGAEALVRWQHPIRGLISPAEFIPVFERNGFIFRLDQYVWEAACRLLQQWRQAGQPLYPISVNVSRVDLLDPSLVPFLQHLMKKYELPSELLELELTESAYMEDPEKIIAVTKKLQSLGFVILMDDFGSGYSSLNMLKDLPVNILKLDLKFLSGDAAANERSNNILHSIVSMAKWLHLPVIAEGVENKQQVEFLRAIGCGRAQGYYYSRPIAPNEYANLLLKEAWDKNGRKVYGEEHKPSSTQLYVQ